MHANFTEVVHGTRRRADDNARRRRGGIAAVLLLCVDEYAEPVRVLEVLVVDEPHRAAHQMGRAERLAPRVAITPAPFFWELALPMEQRRKKSYWSACTDGRD